MRRASNVRPVVTVEDFGITVQLHDPEADGDLLHEEYGLKLTPFEALKPADAVVVAVAHRLLWRGRL